MRAFCARFSRPARTNSTSEKLKQNAILKRLKRAQPIETTLPSPKTRRSIHLKLRHNSSEPFFRARAWLAKTNAQAFYEAGRISSTVGITISAFICWRWNPLDGVAPIVPRSALPRATLQETAAASSQHPRDRA